MARAIVLPAVLIAMVAASGVLLSRIYADSLLTWLLLGAAAGSVGLGATARRLPNWLVAPVSVLAMAGYTLWAISVAARRAELPGTLRDLTADAVANGIPRLLTAMIPVQPQPDTVLIPVAAAWLAGLAATEIAIRARRVLLGYAAPTLLFAGALYLVGPNAEPALTVTLGYAALAALGLAVGGRRGKSTRDAPAALRLRGFAGGTLALAAVAGTTVALAPQIAARIDTRPVDPRQYVTPPRLDTLDENPLSRISGWALAPQQELLNVSIDGAPPADGTAIRLAVLSDYDGVTWRVGATYRSAGRVLPPPTSDGTGGTPGRPLRQEITIGDLSGRLLPAAATPTQVDGARVAYDQASGTLIRPEGLTPGLRYEVTSVDRVPDVNLLPLADVPAGPAAQRMLAVGPGVPEQVQRLAQQLNADHGAPYDRATAIEQFLAEHYRLVSDAPSGHAYPNLGFFLFGPANGGGQKGTSEQFAASFALLARLTGLPTRIIVGFRTRPGSTVVRGGDGYAWPEVLFQDLGWVAFDPLPQPNATPRPVEEDFRPKPEESTPPPTEAPTGTVPPMTTAPAADDAASAGAGGVPTGVVVGAGGGVLLVLLLVAFAVTMVTLRRTLRRRRLEEGPPAERVAGAWLELTDALRLAGRPANPHMSATEVAEHAAAVAAGEPTPGESGDNTSGPDGPLRGRRKAASNTTGGGSEVGGGRNARDGRDAAGSPVGGGPSSGGRIGGGPGGGAVGLAVRPAVPGVGELADLVNAAAFAPDATELDDARTAAERAVDYAERLRGQRSWWRRVVWSLHPGPLRWQRHREKS
ncbi:DUF3488 and transglutaminase-like domain-containing protein [Rhizomonospora bruguierae]|uniref:DUF3488 and transglutaminase-like domain-containing protein n=1 Tax=Rhizomonospora bruguierae TaxID=1581705 RepID=UPI001BD1B182|nr:DUF3488 and transglutaminase-like domain-containing protein [Micromonospora sp. NBRC 107566]